MYKNIPAGDELLFVNEPSLEMSYGDSMYGIVETAVESMSVSKLKDLYLKISEIIASSEDKKMTLLEFEKYACSSTSLTDGQELVNMLRSGDRDF